MDLYKACKDSKYLRRDEMTKSIDAFAQDVPFICHYDLVESSFFFFIAKAVKTVSFFRSPCLGMEVRIK